MLGPNHGQSELPVKEKYLLKTVPQKIFIKCTSRYLHDFTFMYLYALYVSFNLLFHASNLAIALQKRCTTETFNTVCPNALILETDRGVLSCGCFLLTFDCMLISFLLSLSFSPCSYIFVLTFYPFLFLLHPPLHPLFFLICSFPPALSP